MNIHHQYEISDRKNTIMPYIEILEFGLGSMGLFTTSIKFLIDKVP
jgi:hypothetical protein